MLHRLSVLSRSVAEQYCRQHFRPVLLGNYCSYTLQVMSRLDGSKVWPDHSVKMDEMVLVSAAFILLRNRINKKKEKTDIVDATVFKQTQ
jgi:hypothetical protein